MRLYIKEAFISSIIVLIIVFLVSLFPVRYLFLKPLKQGFGDFDVYDLEYAGGRPETEKDSTIVLVQIGNSRETIARQLELIMHSKPKVAGLDILFSEFGSAPADSHLLRVFQQNPNLLCAGLLQENAGKDGWEEQPFPLHAKLPFQPRGYINLWGDELSVVRHYQPFYRSGTDTFYSFPLAMACIVNPSAATEILKRNKGRELIHYFGNQENFITIDSSELTELAATHQLSNLLHNKIVLVGYFCKVFPFVLEDLHFTPVNEHVHGKSNPDMYGVAIYANIIHSILNSSFKNEISLFWNYLFCFLICVCLNIYFLKRIQKRIEKGKGAHVSFLFFQITVSLFLIYFYLQIFHYFNYKLDLVPLILTTILSAEVLHLYSHLAIWMHQKCNYQTVFHEHH